MSDTPMSIAIAGSWGYIGQKFIEAACRLGLRVFVFDPAPMPGILAGLPIEVVEDEARFYALPVDLYHLALHPSHRQFALDSLFARGETGPAPVVLSEKPVADPADPGHGRWLLEKTQATDVIVLIDFIELFDELTLRVQQFLSGFRQVSLSSVQLWRSKDREDPANPRNYKIIVPIQYQETVHCIAYLFSLFACLSGGLERTFAAGLRVAGTSQPYNPPNPQDYPLPVDGKLDAEVRIGETEVRFHSSFKVGAELTKRRVIEGIGDGMPFRIEAEHLEGRKSLIVNGVREDFPPDADAYPQVIQRSGRWARRFDRDILQTDLRFPNVPFAWYTYLLSAMLWDSCADGIAKTVHTMEEFRQYTPGYPTHFVRHLTEKTDS